MLEKLSILNMVVIKTCTSYTPQEDKWTENYTLQGMKEIQPVTFYNEK